MPIGVGRKGGVAKHKRKRKQPTVETRSVRPCLSDSHLPSDATNTASGSGTSSPSSHSTRPHAVSLDVTSLLSSLRPAVCSNTTATATSQGQVYVGSSIVNQFSFPHIPSVSTPSVFTTAGISSFHEPTKKPFVLKFKTPQIKVCQACRLNYDGSNDTMGLVVAREERYQIWQLASSSLAEKVIRITTCISGTRIKAVDPSFELVVPENVMKQLNAFQKLYLNTCFQIPM